MFRILDRYIVREIIPPSFLSLVVFTFCLILNSVLSQLELLVSPGVTFVTVLQIIFYSLPFISVMTLPMSVLAGILIAFGRLSTDMEVVAMRASGVSLYRLLVPVLVFCSLATAATLALSLWAQPWGNHQLVLLRYKLLDSQITSGIKPRVFNEDFRQKVLYIAESDLSGTEWSGILLSDSSPRGGSRLVLARSATPPEFDRNSGEIWLTLFDGEVHETKEFEVEKYDISFFSSNRQLLYDTAKQGAQWTSIRKSVKERTLPELNELLAETRAAGQNDAPVRIEIQEKFAFPAACLIFGVIGISLGLQIRKGTRSSGFTISIAVILVYYILTIFGRSVVMNQVVPPVVGAWMANFLLGAVGILLLVNRARERQIGIGPVLDWISEWFERLGRSRKKGEREEVAESLEATTALPRSPSRRVRFILRLPRTGFTVPAILDRYVLGQFLNKLCLILVAVVVVFLIVDFFQIYNDVLENEISLSDVIRYYQFSIPQILDYMLPVAVLLAVLTALGLLSRHNEITAIKAGGISLYRISVPILGAALFFSVLAYASREYVLPHTNDEARRIYRKIRGAPAASYMPFRQWIVGENSRFFNYSYFDTGALTMYEMNVFTTDPETFRLVSRVYAPQAKWEDGAWTARDGWVRTFDGKGGFTYEEYEMTRLEYPEDPTYFTREIKLPAQMTYAELSSYTRELSDRGFDTTRFRVDLHGKLSFPLICFIIALIGLPFAFQTGKRGTIHGIGLSIAVGLLYWGSIVLFTKLGHQGQLTPTLAAWAPNILFGMTSLFLMLRMRT